jgi:putative tricarboxylic transport membrane protein
MELQVIFSSLMEILTTPKLLGLIMLAVPIGTFFGCVPGLGGKLGIVLLIPFVYGMDPIPGAVFLLAMHAIVHTGGHIPSMLFGVPTNGPEAPLLVDGYPMCRNGQAGRALAASLAASGIGGLIGALVLAAILPVVQPFVLSFGPVEFFWLAVIGITFISALAGKMLVQGLIVGCFGWLVGMIGLDPATGVQRFTFGQLFLWDGFDVISGVLALYALPEMMLMGRKKDEGAPDMQITDVHYTFAQVWEGVVDCFRHWGTTIITSILGCLIGMIPGLGGEAAGWMCYAFTVSRSKEPDKFGKGAIEGVIAPSTAMNAKEGGGLLPTLFFGVPAGSGMAIMLGALIMLGIKPGPLMIVNDLPLVWALIWTIVLSNLITTVLLLAVGQYIGRVANIRASLLVPVVLVFALLGTSMARDHWESMLVLAALGALGYVMRRNNWPRPCFIIGLVLGPTAETSFHKALALFGTSFLWRPSSLIFIALIAASLLYNLRKTYRAGATAADSKHKSAAEEITL